jgi:hypothetical protein
MSAPSLTDALSSLAAELCNALSLYHAALTDKCAHCITDISECNRRASSLAADTHAQLFTLFCPPLARAPAAQVCEKLHAAIATIFGASMLFPHDRHPNVRFSTELQSLCRIGLFIRREIDRLPELIKGKKLTPPDTYAYYTELTRARAAHALFLSHGERSTDERLILDGLAAVTAALGDAYAAMLCLLMENI